MNYHCHSHRVLSLVPPVFFENFHQSQSITLTSCGFECELRYISRVFHSPFTRWLIKYHLIHYGKISTQKFDKEKQKNKPETHYTLNCAISKTMTTTTYYITKMETHLGFLLGLRVVMTTFWEVISWKYRLVTKELPNVWCVNTITFFFGIDRFIILTPLFHAIKKLWTLLSIIYKHGWPRLGWYEVIFTIFFFFLFGLEYTITIKQIKKPPPLAPQQTSELILTYQSFSTHAEIVSHYFYVSHAYI